jgi:hypothetical protein
MGGRGGVNPPRPLLFALFLGRVNVDVLGLSRPRMGVRIFARDQAAGHRAAVNDLGWAFDFGCHDGASESGHGCTSAARKPGLTSWPKSGCSPNALRPFPQPGQGLCGTRNFEAVCPCKGGRLLHFWLSSRKRYCDSGGLVKH